MLEIRVHVRLRVIFNGQYTNIFKEKKNSNENCDGKTMLRIVTVNIRKRPQSKTYYFCLTTRMQRFD